jgi:hypothetical protein
MSIGSSFIGHRPSRSVHRIIGSSEIGSSVHPIRSSIHPIRSSIHPIRSSIHPIPIIDSSDPIIGSADIDSPMIRWADVDDRRRDEPMSMTDGPMNR